LPVQRVRLDYLSLLPMHYVHKFATSTDQLAKTDKLDAQMIAQYDEAVKPRLTKIKAGNI